MDEGSCCGVQGCMLQDVGSTATLCRRMLSPWPSGRSKAATRGGNRKNYSSASTGVEEGTAGTQLAHLTELGGRRSGIPTRPVRGRGGSGAGWWLVSEQGPGCLNLRSWDLTPLHSPGAKEPMDKTILWETS